MPISKPLDAVAWIVNQVAGGLVAHAGSKKTFKYSFDNKPPKPVENFVKEKLGKEKFTLLVYLITRGKILLEKSYVVSRSEEAKNLIKSIL